MRENLFLEAPCVVGRRLSRMPGWTSTDRLLLLMMRIPLASPELPQRGRSYQERAAAANRLSATLLDSYHYPALHTVDCGVEITSIINIDRIGGAAQKRVKFHPTHSVARTRHSSPVVCRHGMDDWLALLLLLHIQSVQVLWGSAAPPLHRRSSSCGFILINVAKSQRKSAHLFMVIILHIFLRIRIRLARYSLLGWTCPDAAVVVAAADTDHWKLVKECRQAPEQRSVATATTRIKTTMTEEVLIYRWWWWWW